jgi:hypothetical protein
MMHGAKKNMIADCNPEQTHSKQRRLAQVEWFLNLTAGKLVGLRSGVGNTRQVCNGDFRTAVGRYNLLKISSLQPKSRAEAVVAAYDLPEAGLKYRSIERTSQPQSQMHVVSGASSLELMQKPQTLLR